VVKVHLKNQKVSIWDSGIDQEHLDTAELSWFDHILYLLRVHQPNKVNYDEDNMPNNIENATGSTRTNWKNVWKIQAFRTWHQPNDYICGAISINRFAFELKPYKSRETVDSELLGLIETPDKLENENYCRAADLFEYLLKNKLDAIKIIEDGLMTMDEEEEDFEQDDEATITKKKKLKKS
jgi:hypothetical protein